MVKATNANAYIKATAWNGEIRQLGLIFFEAAADDTSFDAMEPQALMLLIGNIRYTAYY